MKKPQNKLIIIFRMTWINADFDSSHPKSICVRWITGDIQGAQFVSRILWRCNTGISLKHLILWPYTSKDPHEILTQHLDRFQISFRIYEVLDEAWLKEILKTILFAYISKTLTREYANSFFYIKQEHENLLSESGDEQLDLLILARLAEFTAQTKKEINH